MLIRPQGKLGDGIAVLDTEWHRTVQAQGGTIVAAVMRPMLTLRNRRPFDATLVAIAYQRVGAGRRRLSPRWLAGAAGPYAAFAVALAIVLA